MPLRHQDDHTLVVRRMRIFVQGGVGVAIRCQEGYRQEHQRNGHREELMAHLRPPQFLEVRLHVAAN
jgi:hypothetical protein